MAGPYYCDLGNGTFANATGLDHTGNEYTGPAGLQAAIRGTGNATALAAGEILYLKGTGDLSRLVLLDCNAVDVSAWAPGNVVRNKDGAGDDWTGVVVQANDDPVGGLGADDLVLVWLDTGKTETNINLADGIENTTLAESADPLAAKSTPGIKFDGNSGDGTSGRIRIEGTNTSWVTGVGLAYQAVLDGNSKTVACITTTTTDYHHLEAITLQNSAGRNIGYATSLGANLWVLRRVISKNSLAGDQIYGLNYGVLIRCVFESSSSHAIYYSSYHVTFVGCVFRDSGGRAISINNSMSVMYACLFHDCGGVGDPVLTVGNRRVRLFNLVIDNGGGDGIVVTTGNALVVGSRITNNGGYGINVSGAGDCVEDLNYFEDNTSGNRNNVPVGSYSDEDQADTNEGYTDPAADDYNLRDDATMRALAFNLNWDV